MLFVHFDKLDLTVAPMATIGHGVDHTISQTNAPIVVRTTHLYPLQSHYRSSRVYLGAPLPFGSAQSVRPNSREWPQTIGRHTLYWPVELSGHDVGIEWRTRRLNKQAFECKANTTVRVVWRRSPRGWTKLATWTTSFGPLCKTGQQVIDGRDETSFFSPGGARARLNNKRDETNEWQRRHNVTVHFFICRPTKWSK